MSAENVDNAYKKAETEIPPAWFENRWIIIVAAAAAGLATHDAWAANSEHDKWYFRVLPVGVYILGSLLDKHSSIKALEQVEEAEMMKIDHGVYETNPFLAKIPTKADFFDHLKNIPDYTLSGLTVVFPYFGIAWGLGRTLGSLNNFRKAERLRLAIEIAESRKAE